MYPVATALPPARPGVAPEPVHFLLEDDFCHGRREGRTWTAAQWERDQGVRERDALEEGFRRWREGELRGQLSRHRLGAFLQGDTLLHVSAVEGCGADPRQ